VRGWPSLTDYLELTCKLDIGTFLHCKELKVCFAYLACGIKNSEVAESHSSRRFESQALRVRLESESSKIFSSKSRVMTLSSRFRVQLQELSNHFESFVCKLEIMSNVE